MSFSRMICSARRRAFSIAYVAAFTSALLLFSLPVTAQTPNTASIIVVVVDQNDAVVPGAAIAVSNVATGAVRDAVADNNGSATIAALSLVGEYKVSVSKTGFAGNEAAGLALRAGETATVKIKLVVAGGENEVTIFGTRQGISDSPQIGLPVESKQIDQTPILGRKVTSLPLLNSAFRSGKGTGDLFVNSTYFITGVGSRRATTFTIDGASNDEGWGRQTAVATVPIGSVKEMTILSNAFSAEYGWTSGPALNIVTKSGTNMFHGEGLVLFRPGSWQSDSFSTDGFCPSSVPTCTPPASLERINAVDIPDQLTQFSGMFSGPIATDRTFFFLDADYTRQNRTAFLSPTLPAFVLPPDGNLAYEGHYRQTLVDGRLDHRLTDNQSLMARLNYDRFFDDNPQDAVGGVNAPSVARRYSRRAFTTQVNHTWVISHDLLNEARVSFLWGDPVTLWEAKNPSTTYTRGGAAPFTVGQSRASDLYSHQFQFSDTFSWTEGRHYLRFGGSVVRHTSGGTGNEPGTPTLGTFTFKNTTTAPLDQLTLNDVQNYSQPIDFGIDRYDLSQWLLTGFVQDSFHVHRDVNMELGLRYDRQTLTDAKTNFAPRIGFGWHPNGDSRTSIRGGYGMYYTQIRSNAVASYLVNGLDGLTTYTAVLGQVGFPTCLTCVPVNVDPHIVPANQLPPRDIVIKAGQADFYREQFARYGLNFDLLPNYPDALENPRSQVFTIGAEHEFFRGLILGADYVHQHLSGIDRTVDLNAPAPFDRTGANQFRCLPGHLTCPIAETVDAANRTRPIFPDRGGVRQVNVLTNLGVADYDGLQTLLSYRGNRNMFFTVSYTLSKATNTTEPDGNGIGPNQPSLDRLGEDERGPSVVDQRHRAVISFSYLLPYNFNAGTVMMFASARPFSATTGTDNNGDGANNDRPVVNGLLMSKSAFRGTGTQDISIFVENRIRLSERTSLLLRLEGFNIFNHGNFLGRAVTAYGNGETPAAAFGYFTSAPAVGTTNAIPLFANIDPPRMFQLQARFNF